MSRTTWRALRTELLRGTALIAAATFALGGSGFLLVETEVWAGRWAPLAETIRVLLTAFVPLAVAAGAWQIGRERRRRAGELVGTTPRPGWQPVVLAWAAVTLGTWIGLLLTWLTGAVLVAPVATYSGRGWWLTLAVGFISVAAGGALGVAAGRLVPGRLVAPLAGVITYLALGVTTFWSGSAGWLFPNLSNARDGTRYLETSFQLQQALWFGGLGAALLIVAAARRRWLALIPAALAVVGAVPVATAGNDGPWVVDTVGSELVCAQGVPDVCLTRVNSFLLDELTPRARAHLAKWDEVGGRFTRVVDQDALEHTGPPDDDTVPLYLHNLISWNGLASETDKGLTVDTALAFATYDVPWRGCAEPTNDLLWEIQSAAYLWAGGRDSGNPLADGILAMASADQQEWMGRYLEAARTCDGDAVTQLAEALR